METLDRPDDANNNSTKFNHLSLEKQFTHRTFCEQIKTINSLEECKKLLEEFHLLYLGQSQMFVTMAKSEFKP